MSRRTFRKHKTPGIPKNPAATLANTIAIMNTIHRSDTMKVSRNCTIMSRSAISEIMNIEHQDITLEQPRERHHHVIGMTAVAQRTQTFTTMMLQEHKHTKQKINCDNENLSTLLQVNLLNLCDVTPSSNLTQISMQHGNRKATRLQKQILDSLSDRLIRKTGCRQDLKLSRLPDIQAAGPTTQANSGGNIAFF